MKQTSITLMVAIAAAMASEPGYHFATAKGAGELIKEGFAEQNPELSDGDKLATRLTETGVAEAAKHTGEPEADEDQDQDEGEASAYAIDTDIPIPNARGGKGGSVYPFDSLEVNQSFFVAATVAKPNPAKSLASTVSGATARYAEDTGETETVKVKTYETNDKGERVKNAEGKFVVTGERNETRPKMRETRKFTVRSVEEEGRGKGARVWRIA